MLTNLQGLIGAREAQTVMAEASEPLRTELDALQKQLSAQDSLDAGRSALLTIAGLLTLLCAAGLVRVQLLDSRKRQTDAEQLMVQAEPTGAGSQARERREPGGHFAVDE